MYLEYEMSKYHGNFNIEERLKEIFNPENVKSVSLSDGVLMTKIKKDGVYKLYEYNSNSNEAKEIKPKAIGDISKENYGDYIDFGKNIVGTESTVDDWRILYNDKENNIYAILSDYLPNETGIASNIGLDTAGEYTVYSTTSRETLLNGFESDLWKNLISNELKNKIIVKGASTKSIIEGSFKEKYNVNTINYYRINNDTSNEIDTLYVPHPKNTNYNSCFGYWLSTPRDNETHRIWLIYYDGSNDYTSYANKNYKVGIRPIVIVPNNLNVISYKKNGKTIWKIDEQ